MNILPVGTELKVCEDITRRQQLGIAKYGTIVADNPLSLRAWLQHAYEEVLDQAVYLRRAMEEIDCGDRNKSADNIPATTYTTIEPQLVEEVHNAARVPFRLMSSAAQCVLSVEWQHVEWYSRDYTSWVRNTTCPRNWNEEAYRVPPSKFPPPALRPTA